MENISRSISTKVWGLARIILTTPRSAIEHANDCATGSIVACCVKITTAILACAYDLGVKGQGQIFKIGQNLPYGSYRDPRFRFYRGSRNYHNGCFGV